MDGFTYNNIFETKGIEYIVILAFFASIIPFWMLLNRKAKSPVPVVKSLGSLAAAAFNIPEGIFFGKKHSWAFMEKSGTARVGIDDFIIRSAGLVNISGLKRPGDFVRRGEIMAVIDSKGRHLKITAPLTGTIAASNLHLYEKPDLLASDPYGRGWVYTIKPADWSEEVKSFITGTEVAKWFRNEIDRLKGLVSDHYALFSGMSPIPVLQDGGELTVTPLAELPAEAWTDFQEQFL